jgi:hypothetical protein
VSLKTNPHHNGQFLQYSIWKTAQCSVKGNFVHKIHITISVLLLPCALFSQLQRQTPHVSKTKEKTYLDEKKWVSKEIMNNL